MVSRFALLVSLLATNWLAASDRAVAEWVIRQGGRVIVAGGTQPIADLAALPANEPLLLTAVDLYGTIIEP
ncbi:MAG: hypothetical protein K2Q23_13695, partial [Bryobacteraceae bacterium]|nr:hypothetical protein [Bryobacteraceae bacterium]